jgi:hypothetical protein
MTLLPVCLSRSGCAFSLSRRRRSMPSGELLTTVRLDAMRDRFVHPDGDDKKTSPGWGTRPRGSFRPVAARTRTAARAPRWKSCRGLRTSGRGIRRSYCVRSRERVGTGRRSRRPRRESCLQFDEEPDHSVEELRKISRRPCRLHQSSDRAGGWAGTAPAQKHLCTATEVGRGRLPEAASGSSQSSRLLAGYRGSPRPLR